MISNPSANFRVCIPFPVRNPGKAIKILDKHLGLSFGQRMDLIKAKTPYTLPHDYTLEYATAIAKEFDAAGVAVRVSSSVDGDVTGDIIGRRDVPANSRKEPTKAAKVVAGILIAAVILIVIVVIVSPSGERTEITDRTSTASEVAKPAKPISITASQLFNAYQKNEVQADQSLKGKALLVTGTVDSVNKDFKDSIYIVLSTQNMFMGVHANMTDAEANAAASLNKGDRISVLCIGDGMVVGSPMLGDCHLR